MTGSDLVNKGLTKIGSPYVLGALVPKNDPNYHGAFDCAEFVSWVVYQVTGRLVGCVNDNSQHPESADAGTVYWAEECDKGTVKLISLDEARNTPGAILLREAGDGLDGHIVISQGNGKTVEAHSHVDGVVQNVVDGRLWTHGILLPGVSYVANEGAPYTGPSIPVFAVSSPLMSNAEIGKIQQALTEKGYPVTADSIYGPGTSAAVRLFQQAMGLVVDGQVGPQTRQALGL